MFCERCGALFEGSVCPVCKNKKVREPEEEDLCFLVEKEQIWGDMLSDVLKQNGIPFLSKGRLGAGLTTRMGSFAESLRFFVKYRDIERARSIVEELFGELSEEDDGASSDNR